MSRNKVIKKKETSVGSIVFGIILVCIVGAFLVIVSNNNQGKSFEDSRIIEISYQDYLQKLASGDLFVVYLGRPNCGYCTQFKPVLKTVADYYNIYIYYLNVNTLTDSEYDVMWESVSSLNGQYSDEGEKVIPTPTTVILENTREKASTLGALDYDTVVDWFSKNGVI